MLPWGRSTPEEKDEGSSGSEQAPHRQLRSPKSSLSHEKGTRCAKTVTGTAIPHNAPISREGRKECEDSNRYCIPHLAPISEKKNECADASAPHSPNSHTPAGFYTYARVTARDTCRTPAGFYTYARTARAFDPQAKLATETRSMKRRR